MHQEERTGQKTSECSKSWNEYPSLLTDFFCMSDCVKSPWLGHKIPANSNYEFLACVDIGFCTQKAKISRVKFEVDSSLLHKKGGGGWGLVGWLFESSVVKELGGELRKQIVEYRYY